MASLRTTLSSVLVGVSWSALTLAAPPAASSTSAAAVAAEASSTGVSSAEASSADVRSTGATPRAEAVTRDDRPPVLLNHKLVVGGYGGVDVAYTRMFGQDGAVVGLQGALLLNHRLSLGLAGYGWTNAQRGPDDSLGREQRFETGYGGATLRYSLFFEDVPVYVTFGALFGGGAVALVPRDSDDDFDDFDDLDSNEDDDDVFGLVQPDVTLNANLTRWMRVGLTAGYRVTTGVGQLGFDESDLNGVVLGGQIQFGSF